MTRSSDSGIQSYLRSRMENDVHQHPEHRVSLAECDCQKITDPQHNANVGDFVYHYSDQLDAFTLYEIVSIDREAGTCGTVVIDTDSPEVDHPQYPRAQPLSRHYNTFYHPDPRDRERVEQHGFESQYTPLFPGMHRRIQRRELTVKLYYTPPIKKASSWLRRLLGLD